MSWLFKMTGLETKWISCLFLLRALLAVCKMSFVQSETFEMKFLHFNIERRLFWINSVSFKISASSRRNEFREAFLAKRERPTWILVTEKRRKAATAKEQQNTIYISGIFAWLTDNGVIINSYWLYIYLSKLYSNDAKGFLLNHSVWKCAFKLLWYWFCSLFFCSVDKTKQNQRKYGERELTSVP